MHPIRATERSRYSGLKGKSEPVNNDPSWIPRSVQNRWVLDLVGARTFRKRDYAELPSGQVRVLPPLSHELLSTLPMWGRIAAPVAEHVAHQIARLVTTDYRP